jgi:hypothetical protein
MWKYQNQSQNLKYQGIKCQEPFHLIEFDFQYSQKIVEYSKFESFKAMSNLI